VEGIDHAPGILWGDYPRPPTSRKGAKIQVKVTFNDEKELFESNAKGAYMQTSRRVITVSITGIQP
jgi:hypothetical protein